MSREGGHGRVAASSRVATVGARMAAPALLLFAFALAGSVRADPPLTTADVVRFLRAGISERTILSEVQSRGLSEPVDPARETSLREAGASETLVVALRRAAPPERPVAPASFPARPSGHVPTFAAGARTVRVPVSVVDKSGQPVMGLRAEDFKISDEGKRQPVTLFSGDRRPLRIALALDVSESMKDKIRQVEAALRHFIDILEPEDEILVITFNNRVHVLQDFTSDRALLARVLDMLEPDESTALYDAAAEAIRRVSPGAAESKAVVLVTDGVDTDSATSFDALRELARRSEVPVFSIALDSGNDLRDFFRPSGRPVPGGRGPRFPGGPGGRPGGGGRGGWPGGGGPGGWPGGGGPGGGGTGGWPGGGGSGGAKPASFDVRPLSDLADETGGRTEIVKGFDHYLPGSDGPGNDRLKAAVESIAATLRHRYLLGYEPPEGKSGWRTIRVDVDRPAAHARARRGYYSGA